MGNKFVTIPNIITGTRLLLGIVILYLWYIGVDGYILAIGIGLGLFTDFLDGWIARKWNCSTQFGKQFDHYVDKVFILSLFFVVGFERFPLESITDWSIVLCIIVLAIRDIYIGYFKTKHTTLPSLKTAKRKTVFQGVAIIMYFLDWVMVGGIFFIIAVLFSLWSGLQYIHKAQGNSSTINFLKIKSLFRVFLGKRKRTRKLHRVPTVVELKRLFPDGLTTVIFDIDGTLVAFGEDLSQKTFTFLESYDQAGIKTILYTNSANKKRSEMIDSQGIAIYLGDYSKPSNQGYYEISKQWHIDLRQTVMIGDSAITDNPEHTGLLLGSVLVRPIRPLGGILARVHYYGNRFLHYIVKLA